MALPLGEQTMNSLSDPIPDLPSATFGCLTARQCYSKTCPPLNGELSLTNKRSREGRSASLEAIPEFLSSLNTLSLRVFGGKLLGMDICGVEQSETALDVV